jgi:predicted RNA binding protein YcfA (HicA-like mRNA interferase family)
MELVYMQYSARYIIEKIEEAGWKFDRRNGTSHAVYERPGHNHIVVSYKNMGDEIPIGIACNILKRIQAAEPEDSRIYIDLSKDIAILENKQKLESKHQQEIKRLEAQSLHRLNLKIREIEVKHQVELARVKEVKDSIYAHEVKVGEAEDALGKEQLALASRQLEAQHKEQQRWLSQQKDKLRTYEANLESQRADLKSQKQALEVAGSDIELRQKELDQLASDFHKRQRLFEDLVSREAVRIANQKLIESMEEIQRKVFLKVPDLPSLIVLTEKPDKTALLLPPPLENTSTFSTYSERSQFTIIALVFFVIVLIQVPLFFKLVIGLAIITGRKLIFKDEFKGHAPKLLQIDQINLWQRDYKVVREEILELYQTKVEQWESSQARKIAYTREMQEWRDKCFLIAAKELEVLSEKLRNNQ